MDVNRICLNCMHGEIGAKSVCSSCGSSQLYDQKIACALPIRTILHGRYLVGGTLGQGGFGITYVAYDLFENRRVVIKELFPVFLVRRTKGNTDVSAFKNMELFRKYCDRFIEEARLIYTFRGVPEIVDVYHIFTENRTGYYSMEFLEGETLESLRRKNGKCLTWDFLKPIIRDIVSALKVVHASGNIHRDISPDNIFLTTSGVSKLIDFGSARYYKTGQKMTQILKKGFAPWEQYRANANFGPWTDIYALAATIYVCVTGKILPEATARALNDSLVSPSELGVRIPFYVEDAVMKALGIYPKQRYQSTHEFAAALRLDKVDTVPERYRSPDIVVSSSSGRWQLRGIRGIYAGKVIPFTSNIVIGRDPSRCTLTYPAGCAGISGVHLTLMNGAGPSYPGIRCDSSSQTSYINGAAFSGRGQIRKLQNGDRIAFGDNQIFIVERFS